MDYTVWGELIYDKETFALVKKNNTDAQYFINKSDFSLDVDYNLNKKERSLTWFTILIKNQEYIIENGEIKLHKIFKKCKFIKKLRKDNFMTDKIITMDLETRAIDGYMWPYCVSIYDGKKLKSFYQLAYKDCESMLKDSVQYLMKEKYNKHKVFIHNFSYFDSIFLIKTFSNLSNKLKTCNERR